MSFESVKSEIKKNNKTWLVTGAAGFIGSHLVENLLLLDQKVVGIDNFSGGSKENLKAIQKSVGAERYTSNFGFIEGDICDFKSCQKVCEGVDYVLHQASLVSVPRSFQDPIGTHNSNVTGTLNLMWACVESKVERFVFASSAAVYGDYQGLPNKEEQLGKQQSPYAVGKYICELYAQNFYDSYQLETIGLRYFNIYGPRQCVDDPYAVVIPGFVREILNNKPVQIYGDGNTTRDFCFIDNVVQANFLSALTESKKSFGQTFNVSCSEQISIFELYQLIKNYFNRQYPETEVLQPVYKDFRTGEIRHSLGDISRIVADMGYQPSHLIGDGLPITLDWYLKGF
jgi:UDP-N-acetylglucosamine 4-epimerase